MALPEIFVLDRGFVLVGRPRQDPDDWMFLLLDDCCVVRVWGTQEGLGQLARDGPLEGTVLDPEGDNVAVSKLYVLRRIPCSEGGWREWSPSTSQPSARRTRR